MMTTMTFGTSALQEVSVHRNRAQVNEHRLLLSASCCRPLGHPSSFPLTHAVQNAAQSSGGEDELKVLLPTKRRRLLKLAKTKTKPPDLVCSNELQLVDVLPSYSSSQSLCLVVKSKLLPMQVLLDSDSEGTDSDKHKLNVEEVKKAQGDFDDIDATAVLVANVPKKISKKDMETQLAIVRNREALDQARRMVDSPFTECEEGEEA